MTFKTGDKGETRGGDDYEVMYVLSPPDANGDCIAALIESENILSNGASTFFTTFDQNGKYCFDDPCPSSIDLMPPVDTRPAYDPRAETQDTRAGSSKDEGNGGVIDPGQPLPAHTPGP